MMKKHLYTREEKLKWFGEGEWCDETDEMNFEWADMQCKIVRICQDEYPNDNYKFGGYLCGYVKIPEYHPLYNNQNAFDLDFDVHGGITFNEFYLDTKDWYIGFDCAHSTDVIPSMIDIRKKINEEMKEKHPKIFESYPNCAIFNSSYKTVDFVIEECKKLAEQLYLIKV